MDCRSGKYMSCWSQCVTNFKKEAVNFIKNTTTDKKKEEVWHDILIPFASATHDFYHHNSSSRQDRVECVDRHSVTLIDNSVYGLELTFFGTVSHMSLVWNVRDQTKHQTHQLPSSLHFVGNTCFSMTHIPYMHRSSHTLLACSFLASWYYCRAGPVMDLHKSLALSSMVPLKPYANNWTWICWIAERQI